MINLIDPEEMFEIEKAYLPHIESACEELNYFLQKKGFKLEASLIDKRIDVHIRELDLNKKGGSNEKSETS